MNKLILKELTIVANSHAKNGERRTANLLRRAKEIIIRQQRKLDVLPPIETPESTARERQT